MENRARHKDYSRQEKPAVAMGRLQQFAEFSNFDLFVSRKEPFCHKMPIAISMNMDVLALKMMPLAGQLDKAAPCHSTRLLKHT
jgi:hypothetical protein